jgi:hypothetical protein
MVHPFSGIQSKLRAFDRMLGNLQLANMRERYTIENQRAQSGNLEDAAFVYSRIAAA